MDPNKPVDRRRFFREGLRELLKPLANAIEPLHEAARQLERFDSLGGSTSSKSGSTVWLRPPGSLPESAFLDACSRCGECVRVCPAQCIKIDPSGNRGKGAPYIDPNAMGCVVCEGLQCMHACPTDALTPVALADIDMGTAVWHSDTCVRRRGEECTLCVDHCPVGAVAIELKLGRVHVHPDGCIGCGVCQHDCPTSPKSIVVIPKAAKEAR